MAKYRRKPLVVDAERFNPLVQPWPEGVYPSQKTGSGYAIMTVAGRLEVAPGDYVVTGPFGEKYPCRPCLFRAAFDPIKEGDDGDDPQS